MAWRFLSALPPTPKGISVFYNLFQDKLTYTKSPSYLKWETDLGTSYTSKQWQSAFKSIYKASHCMNHWELSQKLHWDAISLPYVHPKFSHPPRLFAGGDVAYILDLQKCHKLLEKYLPLHFWYHWYPYITRTKSGNTQFRLLTDFPPSCRSIVTHILLAARLLLARRWKSDNATNLLEAVEIVCLHYKYKAMLATKQGTRKCFDSHWQLWTDRFTAK